MCELFSMSSRFPATVSISLEEFARHGGEAAPHGDGWGIAFFDGEDARVIREAESASTSPCVTLIRQHHYRSRLVMSHLRKATFGEITLANTQPFSRELGGRLHLFAHNGDLPDIASAAGFELGAFRPIGTTDSEHAFCHLMFMLEAIWRGDRPPTLAERVAVVEAFAAKLRPRGPSNFLYADGEYLFAHGHQRSQPGREGFHPPGLYWICRTCKRGVKPSPIPGVELAYSGHEQRVTLVASVPLTDERWTPFEEGQLLVCHDGQVQSGAPAR
jgi:predicted glutamine amidotransferase